MTPEVGAVGEGLVVHLKNDVIYRVQLLDIGAVGNVVGDIHDAGVIVAYADLSLAAHVGSAAYNVGQLVLAGIHLEQVQLF